MVGIMTEGGRGSTKTMCLVYCAYIASVGGVNMILRRKYRTPYTLLSNMALYFCHPSFPRLDRTGLTTYLPTCSDQITQRGGNLNPLDLVKMAEEGGEMPPYHAVVGHEWQRWSEARITASLPREAKARRIKTAYYVYDQARKTHDDFMLDTQSRDRVDNYLRDQQGVDYLVVCENLSQDKENELPIPYWTVFIDPFTAHPQRFDYGPQHLIPLSRMLIPMYNTWETPPHEPEVDSAIREYNDELKEKQKRLQAIQRVKMKPEYEEYNAARVKKTIRKLGQISHQYKENS